MARIHRMAWLVAAVALCGGVPAAQAGVVTFTFNNAGFNGQPTMTQTQQGATLSLFNPTGNSFFSVDDDGFRVSTQLNYGAVNGLSMSVTGGTLELTGYEIGFKTGDGSMSLYGTGGSSSTGNAITSTGSFTANGNLQLAPGTTGSMAFAGFTDFDTDFAQLKSLTFNFTPTAVVPEPGTVGLALMGAGALGLRAWRRRGTRAAA